MDPTLKGTFVILNKSSFSDFIPILECRITVWSFYFGDFINTFNCQVILSLFVKQEVTLGLLVN